MIDIEAERRREDVNMNYISFEKLGEPIAQGIPRSGKLWAGKRSPMILISLGTLNNT